MDSDRAFTNSIDIRRNRRIKYARVSLPQGSDRPLLEVPAHLDDDEIARFVENSRPRIESSIASLERSRRRKKAAPPAETQAKPRAGFPPLPPTIELAALDETWAVIHQADPPGSSHPQRLSINYKNLTLTFKGPPWDHRVTLRTLRKQLQIRARNHLIPLVEQFEQRTGLAADNITVRGQRTRWGSCSASGNLSLNLTLLLLPHRLVEYVILHELCHTEELNHADAFWDLLHRHLPDASARREELRRAEKQLPPWVEPMLRA